LVAMSQDAAAATPDTPNLERRTVAAPSQAASHQQQQNPIFKHLKLIKKIEAQNVKSIKQLASPYSPSVHHTLHMYDATITVYEDEPSSIIAYTLSSNAHAQFLEDQPTPGSVDSGGSRRGSGRWQAAVGKVATKRGHRRSKSEDVKRGSAKKSQLGVTEDASAKTSPNKGGGAGDQDGSYPASPQESRKESSPTSLLKHEFSDRMTNFYCEVFFASEFKVLREQFYDSESMADGEALFIRSLSRCVKWDPQGGKSGSHFCKTTDDRLLLKEMTQAEAKSVAHFVPFYIQHMKDAYRHGKPTVLARILGIFRIGFRNDDSNNTMKQHVIIMENLFYKRRISQIYDLKGTMRNR